MDAACAMNEILSSSQKSSLKPDGCQVHYRNKKQK